MATLITVAAVAAAGEDAERLTLADSPALERQALEPLLASSLWPHRALGALRLERFECDESAAILAAMLRDEAWQVRCFAVRSLGRRGVPAEEDWFSEQQEARVIRAALRHRYTLEPERIERGVRALSRGNLDQRVLAAEIASLLDDAPMQRTAHETLRAAILRATRPQAGVLSPRFAALTGAADLRNVFEWQRWLLRIGRQFELRTLHAVQPGVPANPVTHLAAVEPETFARFAEYMGEIGRRDIDLAIALDCTGSMAGIFPRAQGAVDDVLMFMADMTNSLRVSLVGYRDRHQEFETRGWDFVSHIDNVRPNLWALSPDRGGVQTESVYAALRDAYGMTWRAERHKYMILIGDGPPHVGEGGLCIDLARRVREGAELVTHVIQPRGEEVRHFPEIAKAGGGLCVSLEEIHKIVAEMLGMPRDAGLDEEFMSFARVYFELCR